MGENDWVDAMIRPILNGVLSVLEMVIQFIFSSQWITLLFWYCVINLIAVVLMKKDKRYAKEEKRRIKESTLMAVAFAGGAVGMYYAMYKFRHKTLHKKFTIGVPIAIVLHLALISYLIISSFVK